MICRYIESCYWTFLKGTSVVAFNSLALWWTRSDMESFLKIATMVMAFLVSFATFVKIVLEIRREGIKNRTKEDESRDERYD